MDKILCHVHQSYSVVSEPPDVPLLYTYTLLMLYVVPQKQMGHEIVACFIYPHIPVWSLHTLQHCSIGLDGEDRPEKDSHQDVGHVSLQFIQDLRDGGRTKLFNMYIQIEGRHRRKISLAISRTLLFLASHTPREECALTFIKTNLNIGRVIYIIFRQPSLKAWRG